MIEAARIYATVGANLAPLAAGFAKAQAMADSFAGSINTRLAKKFEQTGRKMTTAFTLPIVGIAAAGTKMALDFQQQMTLIQTQAGGSAEDVKKLSKAVLDLAPSTAQGPEELAKALYHLKSLGLDNATAMSVLKQASRGAMTGVADLEETTNALGGAVRTGIRGTQSYSQAMGTLNAIIGAGNMRMQDLVDAMGTGILPTAKLAGLSLRDVGAALTVFTDENMNSRMAMTRMRTALMMMIAPSKKAEGALESFGLSGSQLGMEMRRGGLVGTIRMIHDHLARLGGGPVLAQLSEQFKKGKLSLADFQKQAAQTAQFQALANAFGGSKTASTVALLVNQYSLLGKKYDQIGHTAGNFNKDVAASSKTASNQIKIAWSSVQTALIQIGQAIAPFVVKIAHGIADIAKAFMGLPGPVRTGIMVFAGVVAAVGPLLMIIGAVMTAVETVGTAFGLLVSPVGLVVIALAALGVGIYELIKHWDAVKAATAAAWSAIESAVMSAVDAVEGAISRAWSKVKSVTDDCVNFVKEHWRAGVVLLVTILTAGLGTIIALVVTHWGRVKSITTSTWHAITRAVSGAVNAVTGAVRSGLSRAESAVTSAWNAVRSQTVSSWNAVRGAVVTGLNKIRQVLHDAIAWAEKIAVQIGVAIGEGVIHGVESMAGKIKSAVTGVLKGALHGAKKIFGIASPSKVFKNEVGVPLGEGIVAGFVTGTARLPSKIKGTLRDSIEAGRQTLETARGKFKTVWSELQSDAVTAFDDMAKKIKTKTETLLAGMNATDAAQQLRGDMAQAQGDLAAAMNAAGGVTADPKLLAQIGDAQIKLGVSQDTLNKAIQKYGTSSDQAARATVALHTAQDELAKLQGQLPNQSDAVSQAFSNMTAAQTALTNAIATNGAASKQAIAAQQALATAVANAQVAVSGEQPGTDQQSRDQSVVDSMKRIQDLLTQQVTDAATKRANTEKVQLQAATAAKKKHFETDLTRLKQHLLGQGATMKQSQDAILKLMKKYGVNFSSAGDNLGRSFASGLRNAMGDVDSAAAALAKIVAERMQVALAAVNSVVEAQKKVKGGSGGAVQHRAGGGPVVAGQPYIVGEKGQELFVPDRSGTIIPNSSLRASGPPAAVQGVPGGNVIVQGDLHIHDEADEDRFAEKFSRKLAVRFATA